MKIKVYLFVFLCISTLQAQTFTGTGGPITDDNVPNNFTKVVSGVVPAVMDTNYGLVTVCINITHTYDSDLRIQLKAPDGTLITLADGVGGGNDNFTNTCFNHTAATSITAGSAPFTGTYQPQSRLGNVNNNQNPNGTWTLRITDTYAADVGNLMNWSLTFGPNAQGPHQFDSTNIPLLVINTYGISIPDEPKVAGTMRIIDNGAGLYNQVNDSAAYIGNIGIEIRGNYSASLPQKPFGLETRDGLGAELDTAILGMPSEHDWILMANYNDKAFLRNPLALKLFDEMGHYASRYKLCEVIINNEYQGVYLFCEEIKRDHNRVDIAKLDTNENSGLNLTGGYIWKNDFGTGWNSNYHPIDHPTLDVHYAYVYPKETAITTAQQNYLQTFVDQAESVIYAPNFADSLTGYRQYLSVQSFYDYFIVNSLARNGDGFKKSVYFHKDKDPLTGLAKIKMGPVWDFDWAWKNLWDCHTSATDGSEWTHLVNDCGPDNNSWAWYVRLLQDSTFANELNCRWRNLRLNLLDTTRIFNWIDSNETVMNGAQLRHYETWPILGLAVGAPENDSFPNTYHGEMAKFKMWIRKRVIWLDNNMFGNAINCQYAALETQPNTIQVMVFPNPATEIVYIELPEGEMNYKINISDQSGRMVETGVNTFGNLAVMDVSSLATGIYFIRVHTTQGNETVKKLLVRH
jgi:subtilisin-like proprotein convertase family protein